MTHRTSRLAAAAAILVIALTGCSPSTEENTTVPAPTQAESVIMTDAWVKTVDEGMSAAYGTITNNADQDIVLSEATTTASPMSELHETVANDSGETVMQPKQGGFAIPAGGSLTLEPGSSHIMLMGVTEPIRAGEDVTITLSFEDGSSLDVVAPAKDFAGGNEEYVPMDTDG